MGHHLSDLHFELSSIIDKAQKLLQEPGFNKLQWLPLCQSLRPSFGSSQLHQPASKMAALPRKEPSFNTLSIAPLQERAKAPEPQKAYPPKEVAPKKTNSEKVDSEREQARAQETALQEVKTKKVGPFILQFPPELKQTSKASQNSSDIALWLEKKGVLESKPNELKVANTTKIALAPVVIVYESEAFFENFERLNQAINDRILPCLLMRASPSVLSTLTEALERSRIDCLLYESPKLQTSSFESKKAMAIETEDLAIPSRKLELWKKLTSFLRKEA